MRLERYLKIFLACRAIIKYLTQHAARNVSHRVTYVMTAPACHSSFIILSW